MLERTQEGFIFVWYICCFTKDWLLLTIRAQESFRLSRISGGLSPLKLSANVLANAHKKPGFVLFKKASWTSAVFFREKPSQLTTTLLFPVLVQAADTQG